jgi:hypothetical protein
MGVQEAKDLLKKHGYFTDNLWHVADVNDKFECDDIVAQKILDGALTNEWIMEQIFVTIADITDDMGLKELEEEED